MKMVDTDLMNKYQKKKNRSSIFLPILPIFVFKNGDFTYTGTFYSLIRSRMIFLRALSLKKLFKINTSLLMQLFSKASGFRDINDFLRTM